MLKPRDLCQSSGTKTFLDAMHGGKVHLARFVLDALDRKIINSRTEQGRTPLMFATCLPDPEMRVKFIRLLLDNGAEVNGQDEGGRTALSQACELGHLDAAKLLVQFNADPDIHDAGGNSPLMYAASRGHSALLAFLLKSFKRLGLGVDSTNQAGQSALQVAASLGHGDCVQVLSGRQRGAQADGALPEAPRSPGRAVWSPRPLSRQVMERFTRQFNTHRREKGRPGTPPSPRGKSHHNVRPRHPWDNQDSVRSDHRAHTPEREGRSARKPQVKGRNSWLFARSSSCSPGRRRSTLDSAEHHIFTYRVTQESPANSIPTIALPNDGKGDSEQWDASSPRIVLQSRFISRSCENLLRAESWDYGCTRDCSDGDRYLSAHWGTSSSRPMVELEDDEEALVSNDGASRSGRLLRRFTSPEFQALPRGDRATESEDSTCLLGSAQQ